jgi:precorrin-2/cobalt-factor-2 C20-methyltransferase
MTIGTLFGIGVGPGDPELIPVKSVRILEGIDTVFTAASTKNDYSLAIEIARPYIPRDVPIVKLDFPMSKDKAVKEDAWHRNAARVAATLEEGRDAAFLTLGDPLTYSTYGYLLRHLQSGWPQLPIRSIPGITSYQAAAAAINRPLVEGEESLLVLSGAYGGRKLHQLAENADNVVFLKAYRNVDGICDALAVSDMLDGSIAVSNCSREDQKIHPDISRLREEKPNYWTLIIAGRKHHDTPAE